MSVIELIQAGNMSARLAALFWIAMERGASLIVAADPQETAARIGEYVELGFTTLVFHAPGADQERFLRLFCADVVPLLRERYGTGA